MNKTIYSLIIILSLLVSGCASFGRGVAEAIIKPSEKNHGECRVFSGGFDGLKDIMAKNDGKVKVLMIHGIGQKAPGHSESIVNSLAYELGLSESEKYKDITLQQNTEENDLGHLKIYKYYNKEMNQELTFYEYTWSSIAEKIKSDIAYDNYDLNADKRTNINKKIKEFLNDTAIEPFIYLGNTKAKNNILSGLSQSLCWMSKDWNDIPSDGTNYCTFNENPESYLLNEYVIITHSLGSQISIDGLEDLAAKTAEYTQKYNKKIQITIYMFANQLPAIAIASDRPAITGQKEKYCSPKGEFYSQRFADNTEIVAFSDPNDLLSYSIPDKFENKYIDSRLCPDVSNVLVNVAPISNIFGNENANPLAAHSNYKDDTRVIKLIINGVNNKTPQEKPKEGCYIVRTK